MRRIKCMTKDSFSPYAYEVFLLDRPVRLDAYPLVNCVNLEGV